ncbi:MAG: transposase [Pirellulaceae bacterium]|nr:transposase [Pirellulaceae bacterium]
MSSYRRNFVPGGTFFFTLVTYGRRPILTTDLGRRCLREAFATIKRRSPFQLFAICLLPDHLHCVWLMPSADADFATRWKRIKHEFSTRWLAGGGIEAEVTPAQQREGRRGIWQPRYWEHTVRDEVDLERCVDYIHWNPRKHAIVRRVKDWPYSSFQRFVSEGQYEADWGGTAPASIVGQKEIWGEPV